MRARHQEMVSKRPLRLLIVEDCDDDLRLLLHELERGGYAVSHRRVETVAALRSALAPDENWELVVSDFSLPTMTAHDVLKTVKAERPDLPCIVISGTIAEEAAVDVLRAGARDFVVKERMARLLPAIERELRESAERRRLVATEALLHETRERMQFILGAVGIGTWESDLTSGRTIWSEVLERLHGLQPGTFGGTFDSFIATISPDDRQEVCQRIEQATRDRTDSRIEYRSQWPDGSVHWIVGIGRTLCDDQGTPVRAVGVGMDITAQKHLEEQFRQAQKMESIGRLAGGIAHDFNNLLTVIAGCCDLAVVRVASDPDAAESLEGIRSAAVSASALTRQLLTFSRRQLVRPRLLVLNDTITSFGKILRRLVEENVHIEYRLGPCLQSVRVDPGQVEQVLLNLVANARDAMPGGGTVIIETSNATVDAPHGLTEVDVPPGAYVVLSVTDTGSGMSPDVREHLFEPFFTTKPQGRGTGLGLANVYGIVQESGGRVFVQSELGSGTTFRIYLPVASPSRDGQPIEEKNKASDFTGNETILVVEDTASLRRLNERILQRYGYRVLIAANGTQAQQICAEHRGPIHVVLMDVMLPGDSGPIVGEWIAQRRPETRIIYMSGYTGDAITHHRIVDPCSVFLQKPFDAAQLAGAVREVLSSQRAVVSSDLLGDRKRVARDPSSL
jgi:two-component system cell cycle sensor histidine kinase/response regulator CckA